MTIERIAIPLRKRGRPVDQITIDVCQDCGSVIGDPSLHKGNCPRIKPERGEPIPVWEEGRTIADRAWLAGVLSRHRFSYRPNHMHGVCSCRPTPITHDDYDDHLAEIIYRALEGRS